MKKFTLKNLQRKVLFLLIFLSIGILVQYAPLFTNNNILHLPKSIKNVEAWYDTSYLYKKQLTIDGTMVPGGSTLTNFPVLVAITDTQLRSTSYGGRVTNANGYDIIFTDSSESTKLSHEIESYDQTTGTIKMWVKIPSLFSGSDTTFYVYYGNSSIGSSQENKTDVWSNGYTGVWHLKGNLDLTDSTVNNYSGTQTGISSATGMVGGGGVSSSTTGRITVSSAVVSLNAGTVSMWVKPSFNSSDATYNYFFDTDSARHAFYHNLNTESIQMYNNGYHTNFNPSWTANTWHHFAFAYNKTGNIETLYFDGTSQSTTSLGGTWGSTALGANAQIMNRFSLDQGSTSTFDEVRVSNTVRTAGWIATEYYSVQNQGNGVGKFIKSTGSEVPYVQPPTVTTSAATNITQNSATINGTVTANGASTNIYYWYSTVPGGCGSSIFYTTLSSGSSPVAIGIGSLQPGTTYYFCIYASNSAGQGGGGQLQFNTSGGSPSITSPTSASITVSGATLGGNVTSNGGGTISARGVCYSKAADNTNPQIGGSGVTCTPEGGTSTGVFTLAIGSLLASTQYYFTAYSTNQYGTGYTSATQFTTANPSPTSVQNVTISNPQSYYATLRGQANPNGYQTYGHFRLFTANPGNCSADSGGIRFPALSTNDIDLGSGTGVITDLTTPAFKYDIPLNSGTFLTPNTTYWYCSYAINSYNSTNYTTGASAVSTFTTPDGPASPCDAPVTGNLTIPAGASCTFNGLYNGVDAGTGTKNTATMTVSTGVAITINSGQKVAFGSLSMAKGSSLTMARGASLVGAGVFVHDKDNDGAIDDGTQYVGSTASAQTEFIRRNTLTTYNYAWKLASSSAAFDCDPANANIFRNILSVVKDQDEDGYKTSAAAGPQCVGQNSTINGRTYFMDSTGAYAWLPDAQKLSASTDCQDDPAGAPCAPTNNSGTNGTSPTAAAASTTQINLAWGVNSQGGAVPALTGYDVQICGLNDTTCASVDSTVPVSNATFSYSNSGIACSTSPSYYYRIVAKSGNGNTSSPIFSGVTSVCASPPSISSQNIASLTSTSVTLTSNVNANGAPTTITYKYGTSNTSCSALAFSLSASTGSFTGSVGDSTALSPLTANTTYYYCTTANNSQGTTYNVGNNNGNSNFKTALATAPTMNNVTYSNGVNNISWSSVAGATNYTVYYCTGSSCAVTTSSPQVGTTASTSITHTPTCGTTYGYAVMANNGGGGAAPLSSPVKYISDAAGSVACYRDQDNDGYTLNIQSTICGAACPSGYKSSISSPLDCYDRNAKAYSGSTVYSDRTRGDTSAFDQSGTARTAAVGGGGSDDAGNSGTTYDYNCDGQSTLNGASPTAYVCSGGVQASGITYCSYNAGGYCDNVGTSTYYNSIGSTTTPACGSQPCSNSFTSMSQGSYTVSSCDLNPPFYTSCSGNTSGGTLINGYAAFFASCH